jgi:hypothetical protein
MCRGEETSGRESANESGRMLKERMGSEVQLASVYAYETEGAMANGNFHWFPVITRTDLMARATTPALVAAGTKNATRSLLPTDYSQT